jgi:hypothetical protein
MKDEGGGMKAAFHAGRQGKFGLIFGRMQIDALIGLFRSMAIRPALPRIFWAPLLGGFFARELRVLGDILGGQFAGTAWAVRQAPEQDCRS